MTDRAAPMSCTARIRIVTRLRRLARRHPVAVGLGRAAMVFSAAFGGAYGFISASAARHSGYDPHAYAIGASFLFALACVAIAGLSVRLRWLRKKLHALTLHAEALTDRNWELQESEERSRRLFDNHGHPIVIRSPAGIVRDANDAYCALAGQDRSALIGSRFTFAPLDESEPVRLADGARAYDQQIATPDGPRWIAWREHLLRDHPGAAADIQCIGRDVTARAETGRALAEARDAADAANRAKSRFLAMASHEIRTPLNGILGMSGLLLDTPLTPDQASYASAVKSSGEALLALIEGLLDYSQIEAGRLETVRAPFALAPLVEEVVELLAPRAEMRGLEIATAIDETLPAAVVGDAARLRQVLLNLVGNAIKFTRQGGVAVIVEPAAGGEIALTVRDTGIGIAADAQARIFREFEQADSQTARTYGGTGLGLAISERIVRRMGGRIALDSAPGRGSTFTVTLPLPPAPGAMPHAGFAAPDLTGQAVLLVTPHGIEASLLARRLGHWGAQSCAVTDLAVAAALLPERVWLAVLIDRAFGAAAVEAFAAQAQPHSARRLILVTPATRHDLPAPDSALTGYLVKPVRAASLAARLTDADGTAPPLAADGDGADDAAPAAAPRGLSVLVAEDNEINALLLRALLTRLGHSALVVGDGIAALERWLGADAAGTAFDLVLMDVQMPGLDGIDVTRRIRDVESRAGSAARRTPIVALTANALADDREACLAAGMDGFLVKPLDPDKLASIIASLQPPHVAASAA